MNEQARVDNLAATAKSPWPVKLARCGAWAIVIGLILAIFSGPFNRLGITGAIVPLLALAVGGLLLMIGLLLAVSGFLVANSRGLAFNKSRVALAIAAALLVGGYLVNTFLSTRGVPTLHEISTDLVSPPPFVAIAEIRARNPKLNPAEYVSELDVRGAKLNVPEAQRKGFPDIQPLLLAETPDQAFTKVEKAVDAMGWEKVAAVPADGRIEATDSTRFFGFKDDIVVRIRAEGTGSRVDIRSKSRVGLGDAGANARRVRALMARIKAA
jgi:uncharacterized protein (DUF1499 family)